MKRWGWWFEARRGAGLEVVWRRFEGGWGGLKRIQVRGRPYLRAQYPHHPADGAKRFGTPVIPRNNLRATYSHASLGWPLVVWSALGGVIWGAYKFGGGHIFAHSIHMPSRMVPKASARLLYPGIIFAPLIRMHLGGGRWWFAARRGGGLKRAGEQVRRWFGGCLEAVWRSCEARGGGGLKRAGEEVWGWVEARGVGGVVRAEGVI